MSRLFLVAFIALATALLGAQDPPIFRTGANYVRVDMYATVDGKNVEDLTRDEVELLEDGVLQTIDAFEHVSVRPAAAREARVEPNTVERSRRMAADVRARVFVVFLDTYHTTIEGSANMRLPLIRFLDRLLGPEDMVALMTPEMAASEIALGRKTTAISNIMQADWMWGRRGRVLGNDPKEDLYEACYGLQGNTAAEMKARRREKLALDALEDLTVYLSGIREERKAVVTVTEGWRLYRPNPDLTAGDPVRQLRPGDVLGRLPRPTPADANSASGSTRIECETDRVALAALDHTQRLNEIAEDANRGNVTFYPVHARGLLASDTPIDSDRPPSLRDDAASLRVRQDGLRFLADNTDGTPVINTNDIDSAMQRIVADLSSYYLLAYYSSNTRLDGRFRNLTVRVKRPGVRVRARRGYRGRTADELVSSSTAGPSAEEAPDALTSTLTPVVGFNGRSPFRIRAASWVPRATDGEPSGVFWVVGELDYRTRRELAWSANATADVVVLAADGTEVSSRTLDIRTEDGPFGFEVPQSGGLAAGEYAVRVQLKSAADDTLTLSDTARVVLDPGARLGEAVLWRRGPTTGLQHRRTADPRFQRSERLRLELATTMTEPATARLLDRNGNALAVPVQVSERQDGSGRFRWIVVDATLAPFAPGDYAVEVTQGTSKQVTGFRIVP